MRPTPIAVLALLFVAGCAPAPRLSPAKPGPMPEGATYTGTYILMPRDSLAIVEDHGTIRGLLELGSRPASVSGQLEIKGTATGDLVRFVWHARFLPSDLRREGHGYFRVSGSEPRLQVTGELGANQDEVGTSFRMEKIGSSPPDFSWEVVCDPGSDDPRCDQYLYGEH